jgi:PKD repeat protein
MIRSLLIYVCTLLCAGTTLAQVNYTANTQVAPAPAQFQPGYNSGFAAGWSDLSIATMATGDPAQWVRGSGLWSNRDALFYEALETGGITSKMQEVEHYTSLGQKDLVALTLGGADGFRPEPPQNVRDTNHYCPTKQSTLFRNLYTPIWDGGANGTPYNDTNYYARYMYRTVNQYKDYIQYWEIWNEPGFDFSGNRGWREPGDPEGNWWDADPNPCDYKLHAPVQHYVRMLRISWEIVKTLDPTAHVCMGAPGFASFVDAVSRNTDNPVDGSVTPEYPLKGGAYFDAMVYHAFPHIDGSFITNRQLGAVMRNSDRGAEGVVTLKRNFEAIFEKYGYNGTTYPRKRFLITEINLPRKIFNYTGSTYGGQVPQRNFMMKSYLACKIEKILAMHVYTFGELRKESEATDEFDLMGLYLNMDSTNYYSAIATDAGIGIKTLSDLIYNTQHDPVKSATVQTNPNVRIEAFKRPDGKYVYALWAKMQQDFNELGVANYAFPAGTVSPFLKKYAWTHSITAQTFITASNDIQLDGTPMFLVEEPNIGQPLPAFTANQKRFCVPNTVQFQSTAANADSVRWEFAGGAPTTSKALNATVSYATPGFYTVKQTAYGANGDSAVNEQNYYVHARTAPTAIFYASPNGGNVFFLNASFDADSVLWNFGDGDTSTAMFPFHTYADNGNYLVTMTAFNPCGTTVYQDTVKIEYALTVSVTATPLVGCAPQTVQYQATAPLATKFKWIAPGGRINNDTVPNPLVTYDTAGIFPVSLTVANGLTSATITKLNFIEVGALPAAFVASVDQIQNRTVTFTTTPTIAAQGVLWNFGDSTTSTLQNPTHTYVTDGMFTVTCSAMNNCGTVSRTITVTVEQVLAPVAAFTPSANTGCTPKTIQFTNQSTNSQNYLWSFPGGTPSVSTAQNPSVTYSAAGNFVAQLIVKNAAGADTTTTNIAISSLPMSEFTSLSIDSFTFTGSAMLGNAQSLLWVFGDGQTSTQTSVTHVYTAPGAYDLLLIASNSCGNDTAFSLITISGPIPVAAYSAVPNQGCTPLSVQYNDQSLPAPTFREWKFPGGTPATSSAQNPVVVYNTAGIYSASLIVGSVWGRDTVAQAAQVTVGSAPSANFTYMLNQNMVAFTNGSVGQTGLTWVFGDGTPNSNLANPTHTYQPGTYTVTLSASNTCGASLFEQTINIISDTENPNAGGALKVVPNPSTDEVYFLGLESGKTYETTFFDMAGSKVLEQTLACGTDKCGPVDIRGLVAGSYQVRVSSGALVWVVLVVKG